MEKIIFKKILSLVFLGIFASNGLIFVLGLSYLPSKLKTTEAQNCALVSISILVLSINLYLVFKFDKEFENLVKERYKTDKYSARMRYSEELEDFN